MTTLEKIILVEQVLKDGNWSVLNVGEGWNVEVNDYDICYDVEVEVILTEACSQADIDDGYRPHEWCGWYKVPKWAATIIKRIDER